MNHLCSPQDPRTLQRGKVRDYISVKCKGGNEALYNVQDPEFRISLNIRDPSVSIIAIGSNAYSVQCLTFLQRISAQTSSPIARTGDYTLGWAVTFESSNHKNVQILN